MSLPQKSSHTIDDIYDLPEGERAELIDGELYAMAPPGFLHQKLVMQLSKIIANYIDSNKGSCIVLPAPFAVFLNEDNKTYVEPDISVICDQSKIDDRGCNGAPDWIIEIVSPKSRKMDYIIKLFIYRTAGVKEYWIVDSDKGIVIVYNFNLGRENGEAFTFKDTITSNLFGDLAINIRELML